MSKGDVKINISGGNANFGNVSRGDYNNLESTQEISFELGNIEEFYSAIQNISNDKNVDLREVEKLKLEVEALAKKINDKDIASKIKALYEKYYWAIDPLKKLFSMALP